MVRFLPTMIENEPVLTSINADRAPLDGSGRSFVLRKMRAFVPQFSVFLKKVNSGREKYLLHSTLAHTYANRWNAVMCPKKPNRTSIQPNQESP
jgi:hypothetical protein